MTIVGYDGVVGDENWTSQPTEHVMAIAKNKEAEKLAATNDAEQLDEIRKEMLRLLQRAKQIVRDVRVGGKGTARVYCGDPVWYPHIAVALGHRKYATPYDTTMLNHVQEMRGVVRRRRG